MSNSKKFVAKNGVQTQNILFVSTDEANNTNLTVLNSGDISIDGNVQLDIITANVVQGSLIDGGTY
jgi:hypothetical protein